VDDEEDAGGDEGDEEPEETTVAGSAFKPNQGAVGRKETSNTLCEAMICVGDCEPPTTPPILPPPTAPPTVPDDGEAMCTGRKEDVLEDRVEEECTERVRAFSDAEDDEAEEDDADEEEGPNEEEEVVVEADPNEEDDANDAADATSTLANSHVTSRDTLCIKLMSLIRFASSSSSGVLLSNSTDLFGAASLDAMMDSCAKKAEYNGP